MLRALPTPQAVSDAAPPVVKPAAAALLNEKAIAAAAQLGSLASSLQGAGVRSDIADAAAALRAVALALTNAGAAQIAPAPAPASIEGREAGRVGVAGKAAADDTDDSSSKADGAAQPEATKGKAA